MIISFAAKFILADARPLLQ